MRSPFAPVALFVALFVSVGSTVPLAKAGSGLVWLGVAGFVLAQGALAWIVLSRDRAADPRRMLLLAADRFEERWPRFERDFWAHVAAANRATRLD
jgi:hypothetical protein